MDALLYAGMLLLAVLGVVVNIVLANWANYIWHFGEPIEGCDES